MKCPSVRRAWRWFSILVALIFLVGINQPESTLAAPQKTVFRGATLTLMPLYLEKSQICVGQKERYAVLVVNGYYANVPGATVHAKDKTFITGANGIASWSAIAEKPGQTTVTIYATKDGYSSSNPSLPPSMSSNAPGTCAWITTKSTWIRLEFGYSRAVSRSRIHPSPSTMTGSLSLLTGQSSIQGQYHGTVYDQVRPMSCSPQPKLEGPYSIQFSGNYKDGLLTINLSAFSVALPGMVTIQCVASRPELHHCAI